MALAIPRPLVEFILLGPEDDRRQLQDSPILGDFWLEFARNPAAALELLITPFREHAAGTACYRRVGWQTRTSPTFRESSRPV